MPISLRTHLALALASAALTVLAPRAGLAQAQPTPPLARAATPAPVIFESDLPREAPGLWGAGIALSALGAVGVAVGGLVMETPGAMNAEPTTSLPVLLSGYAGVGLGTGMIIAGRDRDYGRAVPRRSLGLATVGVTVMTVSAGLSAAMNVWPTRDSSLGDVGLPSGERGVSESVTFSVGLGAIALFSGGLVMLLIGSAQAPDKAGIEVASARAPALRLSLPTLAVNPLYTERELSRYGVAQGAEVHVGLLRGAF